MGITAAGNYNKAGKKRKFLEALRASGNVSKSAKVCAAARPTLYQWRDADEAFAAAWEDALEEYIASLEEKLDDLGREGNATALFFRLKGLRPEMYRDNVSVQGKHEHSGPNGAPIPVQFFDASAALAALAAGPGGDHGEAGEP